MKPWIQELIDATCKLNDHAINNPELNEHVRRSYEFLLDELNRAHQKALDYLNEKFDRIPISDKIKNPPRGHKVNTCDGCEMRKGTFAIDCSGCLGCQALDKKEPHVTHYTEAELGKWIKWPIHVERPSLSELSLLKIVSGEKLDCNGIANIFAIKFSDRRIWDTLIGWRK